MTISKRDLDQLVNIDMDEGAKEAFLKMVREEQLLAILGMQAYIRTELSLMKKDQINFSQDLDAFKVELRSYRVARERRETQHEDDVMTTTGKIAEEIKKAFSQRFDFWLWFRDRVLPTVLTAISLGILYLVFGGKVP